MIVLPGPDCIHELDKSLAVLKLVVGDLPTDVVNFFLEADQMRLDLLKKFIDLIMVVHQHEYLKDFL